MGHQNDFAALNELDLRTLQSRGEAELRFEARVPSLGMRKFLATNLERDPQTDTWRWIVNLPVLTATLSDVAKNSLSTGDRFGGPALFVIGGRSRYVDPLRDFAGIGKFFSAARIEVIADAGHNPHMDSRVEFVRVVLNT
jgi:pimeloyl-ACP methyl ester carboxylesterase